MNMLKRKERVKGIKQFLIHHPIKPGAIEVMANLPATTLSHVKSGTRTAMKPAQIRKVERILSKYGFKPVIEETEPVG